MGFHRGPKIVTDGLVLALDAANHKSYPGSGTTWYDKSGNENNFNIVNGALFETASNGGVVLDGGNEYIKTINSSSISDLATSDFSIETVVRSDDGIYPRSRHPLKLGHTAYGNNKGWSVGHRSSDNYIEVRASDGVNISYASIYHETIEESTYYHRIFTVSRESGCLTKYYLNGNYVGQHNATSVTGEIYDPDVGDGMKGLSFGFVWGWRFIGSLNLLKVHNRALTASEILQSYNATKSRFGL